MYGIGTESGSAGNGGFSFTANSPLIANILDTALNQQQQRSSSGNMFEAKESRKPRSRARAKKPTLASASAVVTSMARQQQTGGEQLSKAFARIIDSQVNRKIDGGHSCCVAGGPPYHRIGANVMELHARRARDAHLSTPLRVGSTSSVKQLLNSFRRACLQSGKNDDLNAFTVNRFLLYCAAQQKRHSGNGNDDDDNNTGRDHEEHLPVELSQLLLVSQVLASARESIAFDPKDHVYYHVELNEPPPRSDLGGQRRSKEAYAMSVTKSLDLLFGEFDADSVARRIIQSQRWKSNALYKELAFDMAGRQRTEGEVIAMLKKRWNDSRDKGTELHAYIQSLTSDDGHEAPVVSRFAVNETTTGRWSSGGSGGDPAPLQLSSSDAMAAIEVDEATNLARARELWSNLLHREFASRSPGVAFSSQLAARIDASNLAAFDSFNQRRVQDGWLLLASEYIVYDRSASLAGSIDAIYLPYVEQPNLVVLVDWKRCDIDLGTRYSPFIPGMRNTNAYSMRYPKCNYWKYAMQLNVYRELLERLTAGRLVVIDMLIVSLPPDVHEPRVFSVPRLSDAQLFITDVRAAVATTAATEAASLSSSSTVGA